MKKTLLIATTAMLTMTNIHLVIFFICFFPVQTCVFFSKKVFAHEEFSLIKSIVSS